MQTVSFTIWNTSPQTDKYYYVSNGEDPDGMTEHGWQLMGVFKQSFEPPPFNPEPIVRALEIRKQKARAEFQARIDEIDEQISKCLAITNKE